MLIEFRIQLDGAGGARLIGIPAPQNADAVDKNAPVQQQLPAVFQKPTAAAAAATQKNQAGDQPGPDLSTGSPQPFGSGVVFVLGPIVISGSASAQSSPSGDQPGPDLSTGAPVQKKNKNGPALNAGNGDRKAANRRSRGKAQ